VSGFPERHKAAQLQIGLARAKILIVLDNADDEKVLAHLLNILSPCSVIITSRSQVTAERVYLIGVGRLDRRAAVSLLANRMSRASFSGNDGRIAEDICAFLGDLPLAIVLLAARVRHSPDSLQGALEELKLEGLDEFTSVMAKGSILRFSFEKSFRVLDVKDKELFTTMGAFPGDSLTLDAVSACTGFADCARRLEKLVAYSLVQAPYAGRYSLHPLLKLYAQENASSDMRNRVAEYYIQIIQFKPDQAATELSNVFGAIDQYYQTKKWAANVGQLVVSKLIDRLEVPDSRGRSVIVTALARIGNAAVLALTQALHTRSSVAKYYAAQALGKIGDNKAVDSLLIAIADQDPIVQRSVVSALGKLEDPRAVSHLVTMLGSPHADLRIAAKDALFELRNVAIDALINALHNRNVFVRYHATQLLGEMATPRAVPGLISLLAEGITPPAFGDNVGEGSITAIVSALSNIGSVAVEGLISAIEESIDSRFSQRATRALVAIGARARGPLLLVLGRAGERPNPLLLSALEEIGDHRMLRQLCDLLISGNAQTRYQSAKKLGAIGGPTALVALKSALADRTDLVRSAVVCALGEMEATGAIPALVWCLQDRSSEVRFQVVRALQRMGGPESLESIFRATTDKSDIVRAAAAEAIGLFRDPRAEPILETLFRDKNHTVRAYACASLGKIGGTWAVQLAQAGVHDKDSTVACNAAEALGAIADLSALPDLERTALSDKRETVWGYSVGFAAAKSCERIIKRESEGLWRSADNVSC